MCLISSRKNSSFFIIFDDLFVTSFYPGRKWTMNVNDAKALFYYMIIEFVILAKYELTTFESTARSVQYIIFSMGEDNIYIQKRKVDLYEKYDKFCGFEGEINNPNII